MVEVLEKAESLKKKSGRPHTLAIEDQLLLTLNSYATTALNLNWQHTTISLKVM